MSHQAGRAACDIQLPSSVKLVLMVMAVRACPKCGLTWLGSKRLMVDTGLGERAVQTALQSLQRADLIRVRAYPQGGRGRATEYVVLPLHTELSTAPCGECLSRMRNPAHGAGIDPGVTINPAPPAGYAPKPRTKRRENPARDAPPTGSEQNQQEGADQSAQVDPSPAARGGAEPRPLEPPRNPALASDALARVSAMVDEVSATMSLDLKPQANGGAQGSSTEQTTEPR